MQRQAEISQSWSLGDNIDYMQLDSQFNVQLTHYQSLYPASCQTPFSHSPALHRQYLQLYEQQIHPDPFQQQSLTPDKLTQQHSAPFRLPSQQARDYEVLFQNRILKRELGEAYGVIRSLREQLRLCRAEISCLRKLSVESEFKLTHKQGFILQELQAVLQNKTLLDEQVEYLKSELKNNYRTCNPQPHRRSQPNSQLPLHSTIEKPSQSRPLERQPSQSRPLEQQPAPQNREKQFVKSIQDMYNKIVGKGEIDLVVIWRWLKQTAYAAALSKGTPIR